ncbi:hypothetical protein BHAOGJBA_1277 [Methylobacterium hispanicum]|uniref:DUF4240 domain-containing protein n=1 Tax=Methylobacterium hispanicum TaxID=270350 RepID=A0AAV4ZHB5_9HYPH|nr:hypothetical protein [Methylobacterium hispanicum]GJD87772.1 hypothetical protein BHAOGJBA_1277 [Methylobacterium hispanicum]
MSTDWQWCVVARLKADLDDGRQAALEQLLSDARYRADIAEGGVPLGFGEGTTFDAEYLDIPPGAEVFDGMLRILTSAQNLEREIGDDEGIVRPGTQLDELTGTLDRLLDGPRGEVVGWIRSEHHDWFHAHPLIRGRSGRIRMYLTRADPHDDPGFGHLDLGPRPVLVPRILDVALLPEPAADRPEIDPAALVARYSLDGTITPSALVPSPSSERP